MGAATALIWHNGGWLAFDQPKAVLAAHKLADVLPILSAAEAWAARGGWAVGFLAYEAASAFDPALATQPARPDLPLAWFGLFDQPSTPVFSTQTRRRGDKQDRPFCAPPRLYAENRVLNGRLTWDQDIALTQPSAVGRWQPSQDALAFARAIDAIKAAIERGETYQVNYTMRLRAEVADAWGVMDHLARPRPAPYAAWLDAGRFAIASGSPELFFALDGEQVWSRPMKGTRPRGRWAAEDERIARELVASEKDLAENVMIVDMLRNDLGRIATIGSVQVPALFTAERYPTVWQMTSTVRAQTRAPVSEILAALFPCASITGAPKASTMAHIARLEDSPRGVYTGAIGFVGPGRQAQFNVAIRTATVDRQTG